MNGYDRRLVEQLKEKHLDHKASYDYRKEKTVIIITLIVLFAVAIKLFV